MIALKKKSGRDIVTYSSVLGNHLHAQYFAYFHMKSCRYNNTPRSARYCAFHKLDKTFVVEDEIFLRDKF